MNENTNVPINYLKYQLIITESFMKAKKLPE